MLLASALTVYCEQVFLNCRKKDKWLIWQSERQSWEQWIDSSRTVGLSDKNNVLERKPSQSKVLLKQLYLFSDTLYVCVCIMCFYCICEWKLMPCLSPRGSIGALLPRLQERSETGSGLATAITLHHLLWACTCMHLHVHRYTVHVYMDTFVWRRRDDRGDGRAIQNLDEKSFKALSLL